MFHTRVPIAANVGYIETRERGAVDTAYLRNVHETRPEAMALELNGRVMRSKSIRLNFFS